MRISDWSSDVCSSDLGGHLEASGFLLDRIRRRLRPRNRQTRKSLCQPRIEESALDLRATVLAVSTTRSAVSQPVPAQPPHATSPGQSREQSREQCQERKSVVEGKSVSARVSFGGRRCLKKKTIKITKK